MSITEPKRKYRRRKKQKKRMKPTEVKKIVRSMEPTRTDLFNTSASLSSTPSTINNLCNIQFNDDPSTFSSRQQTKIKMMSFRCKGELEVSGLATDNIVRLMIVRKHAQDGAAFDPRQCFLGQPGSTINYLRSQVNKRYCTCYYDRTTLLQNQDPSLLTNERYPTVPWKKLIDIKFKFPGSNIAKYPLVANATVVQPYNYQFYLIGVSDSLVNTPTIDGQSCVFFKNC